jgi:hypothetical protein
MKKGPNSGTTKKDAQPKAAKPKKSSALAERDAKRGIKFDVDKAVKLCKEGKTVSEMAQAMGFKPGTGIPKPSRSMASTTFFCLRSAAANHASNS